MTNNEQFQTDAILWAAEVYKTAFIHSDDEVLKKAEELLLKISRFDSTEGVQPVEKWIEELNSCTLDVNQDIYFTKHKMTEAWEKRKGSESDGNEKS